MRRLNGTILFLLVLGVFLRHDARAQFHAIHIPESRLAGLRLDGDSSDWSWIAGDKYTSRAFLWHSNMPYTVSAPLISEDSLNFRFVVGWSEAVNRLYILAIVYDKERRNGPYIHPPNWFYNDCVDLTINPMSDGREGHTLKYRLAFPLINKQDEVGLEVGPEWIKQSKSDIGFAGRLWKAKDGSYVAVYEISLSLWDRWDTRGAAFSKRHQLAEGQQLPLGIWFNNDAYRHRQMLVQWTTVSSEDAILGMDPFNLSDFVMDAPAEKEAIWSRVNRVLKP